MDVVASRLGNEYIKRRAAFAFRPNDRKFLGDSNDESSEEELGSTGQRPQKTTEGYDL